VTNLTAVAFTILSVTSSCHVRKSVSGQQLSVGFAFVTVVTKKKATILDNDLFRLCTKQGELCLE